MRMSWTDVFPILSDEMVSEFQSLVSEAELRVLETYFGVDRVENPRSGRHLVATSLFWKPADGEEEDFPIPTRDLIQEAGTLGFVSRYAPWEHYVKPLIKGAATLQDARPDVVLRVYLAADLDFLAEELVEVGCEVMVMKSSSLRHNPGAMWRFLAFEEEGRFITIMDADHMPEVLHNIERSEHAQAASHGLWRAPYMFDGGAPDNDPGFYRPINACQFGGNGGVPTGLLMKAMVWHTKNGSMPLHCRLGGRGEPESMVPIIGTNWPSYGFDEWFLSAAFYPRMAFEGVLTFVHWNDRRVNHWLALDVEYSTWANPKSEIFYYAATSLVDKLEVVRRGSVPRSNLLVDRMEVKRQEQAEKPSLEPMDSGHPLTLVVARYKENIRWLLNLPEEVTVVLYNKGPELPDEELMERVNHLEQLPNVGREADTYLHHLGNFARGAPGGWTVFCQGDPFPHSPDFIQLLKLRNHWADIQPLTAGYVKEADIPPANLRLTQDADWLGNIPVYTEFCSAATLDMNGWQDEGGRQIFRDYCQHHRLPRGWSISGHFLECCGLPELAQEAWDAELLRFTYGAMFGVRNERLALIPQDTIPAMRRMAQGHYAHGYVFEKMWLHLFGLPFVQIPRTPLPAQRKVKVPLVARA